MRHSVAWAVAQRRAIVEEGAAVPLAIPAVSLAGQGQPIDVSAPAHDALTIATLFGNGDELPQGGDQEPCEPDAFAAAFVAHAIHAVIPVSASHEWEVMGAGGKADGPAHARNAS